MIKKGDSGIDANTDLLNQMNVIFFKEKTKSDNEENENNNENKTIKGDDNDDKIVIKENEYLEKK